MEKSFCQKFSIFYIPFVEKNAIIHFSVKVFELNERNWVFATNCDFLIHISLQPSFLDLRYFKLLFLMIKYTKFEILKVCTIRWQRYKEYKIWVCGKDSIPFRIFTRKFSFAGNPSSKFAYKFFAPLIIVMTNEREI